MVIYSIRKIKFHYDISHKTSLFPKPFLMCKTNCVTRFVFRSFRSSVGFSNLLVIFVAGGEKMARKEGGLGGCRKTCSQSQTGTRRLRRSGASYEKGTEVLAKNSVRSMIDNNFFSRQQWKGVCK